MRFERWLVSGTCVLVAGALCACEPKQQPAASGSGSDRPSPVVPLPAASPAAIPSTSAPSPAPAKSEKLAPVPEATKAKLDKRGMVLELPARFSLKELGPNRRFDFKARPKGGAFEVLYGLGAEMPDTSAIHPMVPRAMYIFVHNYARDGSVCDPVPAPAEIVRRVGADQVFRLCFQPAEYLGDEFRFGITYGLYKRNVGLVLIAVLTNDSAVGLDVIGPAVFALKYR